MKLHRNATRPPRIVPRMTDLIMSPPKISFGPTRGMGESNLGRPSVQEREPLSGADGISQPSARCTLEPRLHKGKALARTRDLTGRREMMRESEYHNTLNADAGDSGLTRREFLEIGMAATFAAGAEKLAWADTKPDTKGDVPRRNLGRTGEKVSI